MKIEKDSVILLFNLQDYAIKEHMVKELLTKTKRFGMNDLLKYMNERGFFTDPSSTKYHGSYRHGLLDHCTNVFYQYYMMCHKYNIDISEESILICAFLHDICKCGLYIPDGEKYKWNHIVGIRGHAKLSLERIKRFIELTNQEEQIIKYHMGMYYTHELSKKGSGEYSVEELKQAFNNISVKLFHYADDIVANCIDR